MRQLAILGTSRNCCLPPPPFRKKFNRISIISRLQRRGARRAGPPPRDGYRWPNLASSAQRYRPLTKPKHSSSTVGRSGIERHEDAHATALDRPPTEQPQNN